MPVATKNLLMLELRGRVLKGCDQVMRSVWSSDIRFQNNFCGARRFAIELTSGFLVGPERGAIERYAGKNTSRAGVAQNFRAHVSVSVGGSRTSLRSRGDRCIRP